MKPVKENLKELCCDLRLHKVGKFFNKTYTKVAKKLKEKRERKLK